MMNNFQENNERLNHLLEQGQAMKAFERFYDEDIVMQENELEPRKGKAFNREQCTGFVTSHPDLKLTVLSVAYGATISIQEVLFQYTDEKGEKVNYPEVAVRHWQNGLIQREKFYYAS